jgi:hypothetical protein
MRHYQIGTLIGAFEEKAGKCGINLPIVRYEISFGIGHYGTTAMPLNTSWKMRYAGYSDKDGVNFAYVNEQMNTTPSDVTVDIRLAEAPLSLMKLPNMGLRL